MARLTTRSLTALARAEVSPHLELVNHGDYFTWIFDNGDRYEERSVMTPRLNGMEASSWLFEARELVESL